MFYFLALLAAYLSRALRLRSNRFSSSVMVDLAGCVGLVDGLGGFVSFLRNAACNILAPVFCNNP